MPPRGHASGGARGRARRRGGHSEGGHESSERWLVTYADMLTLLLVLFIVLFSISVVNKSKFITLRSSLAAVFGDAQKSILPGGNGLNDSGADSGQQVVMSGVQPIPGATGPNTITSAPLTTAADYHSQVASEVQDFRKIEQEINAALDQGGMSGAVQFSIDRRGLVITVLTNALVFPGNSATLLPGGQHILAVIAPPLRNTQNKVEVDGFTNQEQVSTDPYPTGWELSSARASAVVRSLISGGIAESRLSAVGFSDQRPLVPPSDPLSITRNRRVEIVVLTTLPAAAGDALQAAGSQ
jgi:chemotaxis protein MotB